jgi:hypothetical protein
VLSSSIVVEIKLPTRAKVKIWLLNHEYTYNEPEEINFVCKLCPGAPLFGFSGTSLS